MRGKLRRGFIAIAIKLCKWLNPLGNGGFRVKNSKDFTGSVASSTRLIVSLETIESLEPHVAHVRL